MKIRITRDLMVACTDGVVRTCKPGDAVSVYHLNGRRLLYRRMALWIGSEACDPQWDPPPHMKEMKALIPQHDKMIRGAMNKGAA